MDGQVKSECEKQKFPPKPNWKQDNDFNEVSCFNDQNCY